MSVYHPIGTIVKLSLDENRLFMIAGYLVKQGNRTTHDYFAVPYPLGLVEENQYIIFNRECITDVIHIGYCDEECEKVLAGYDEFVDNLKKELES